MKTQLIILLTILRVFLEGWNTKAAYVHLVLESTDHCSLQALVTSFVADLLFLVRRQAEFS